MRKKKQQQQNSEDKAYSWLYDKGVYNRELQLEIAGAYAVENGFTYNRHYYEEFNRREMFQFIQSRWSDFINYVFVEWNGYLSKVFQTFHRHKQ